MLTFRVRPVKLDCESAPVVGSVGFMGHGERRGVSRPERGGIAMVHSRGLSVVSGLALVVALLAGCQMAQGPSDEAQIRDLVKIFVDAGNKGDVDAAVSILADDFMTEDGMDKEDMTFQLEDGIATGIEFEATELEVKVAPDGKSGTVSGVMVDYTPYVATVVKRNGKWLVTGVEQEY